MISVAAAVGTHEYLSERKNTASCAVTAAFSLFPATA